jgi:NADH:ubiquinone oxidoreductase subunit E
MSECITKCPYCKQDDEQKFAEIAKIIDLYKDKEGSLIQILHLCQEIYGYLPLELQKYIASSLKKPLSEVSGVITFYSFFSTKPRGRHTIRVCLGTACYVRGGKKIVEAFKDIVLRAYGQMSADGKYFDKSPEMANRFSHTEAYFDLFMELSTNAKAASDFINGILPQMPAEQPVSATGDQTAAMPVLASAA